MSKKYGGFSRVFVLVVVVLIAAFFGPVGCGDDAPGRPWGAGDPGAEVLDVELDWLQALNIPSDDAHGEGEIRQAWQLDENLVLFYQVQDQGGGFHLFHTDSGQRTPIVSARENAVLEKVAGGKLFFVVKRVDGNGDQAFPERLVFDLTTYKATREPEAFFRRDVVFGGSGSPLLTLDGIYPRGDDVVLDFAYAAGQAPTGVRPLTTADYAGRKFTLRIYNAGAREGSLPTAGEDSLVGRISCTDHPPFFPPEQMPLLKSRYPYGAAWQGQEKDLERPSIKVEINLRQKAAYRVRTVLRATGLVYVVEFKPDGVDTVHGLDTAGLDDAAPEEIAALYWRARQERSLGALHGLLTDDAEVGSLADALLQTEREWQRGRMMVVSFEVGKAAVNGDRAVVPVSYRQTGWDGRLIVRENVSFGLSRVNGVWKVNLSDHILALAR